MNQTDPKQSTLFRRWHDTVSKAFSIDSVEIQSVDYAVRKGVKSPIFIKLKAMVRDETGRSLTRTCFLRGPSVAILVILVCEGVEYAVLVNQGQPAAGIASHASVPAGMLDDNTVDSAALHEIEEETGLRFRSEDLVDLCEQFSSGAWRGIYPSPGACDEIIYLFYCRKEVTRDVIESLASTATGLPHEQEYITLSVVKLEDVCALTPDSKTHSAILMYQTLKRREPQHE